MLEGEVYHNRTEAGNLLAQHIATLGLKPDLVVALPRGGVPVGLEIARSLNVPLQLLLVRKIGHPANKEYAIGAVTEKNILLSEVSQFKPEQVTGLIKRERMRIKEMNTYFDHQLSAAETANKHIMIVDDGIATGQCMQLALNELKMNGAAVISIAVPVCPVTTSIHFKKQVKHFICLNTPKSFTGIGAFYEDFSQLSDQEVAKMLTFTPVT